MKSKTFCIGLHELDDGPFTLQRPLTAEWVNRMLENTDVQYTGKVNGNLDLILTKTGVDVLVQGRLDLKVSLPCARTLDPAIYHLKPEVFLLLAPSGAPSPAQGRRRRERPRSEIKRNDGQKEGSWGGDEDLSGDLAAQDTYSDEQIVLDDFLREFILLDLPMVPLREDLRNAPFEANPPLPEGLNSTGEKSGTGETDSLDPRLSPLRDLKARLEKKE